MLGSVTTRDREDISEDSARMKQIDRCKPIRSLENMKGLADVIVHNTFKDVAGIAKVAAVIENSEIVYHIFVEEGCLGKLIRNLKRKAISIQDLFEDLPMDFRVHDIRSLSDLKLESAEYIIDNEGEEQSECIEVKQISSS
jgi:hypothetical protein